MYVIVDDEPVRVSPRPILLKKSQSAKAKPTTETNNVPLLPQVGVLWFWFISLCKIHDRESASTIDDIFGKMSGIIVPCCDCERYIL